MVLVGRPPRKFRTGPPRCRPSWPTGTGYSWYIAILISDYGGARNTKYRWLHVLDRRYTNPGTADKRPGASRIQQQDPHGIYCPALVQLYTSQYDGSSWTQPIQIQNQGASVPALAVVGEWGVIVYSGATNSKLSASYSKDGTSWSDPIQVANRAGCVPAAANMRGDLWVTYSDASGSMQLYVTSAVHGGILPLSQSPARSGRSPGLWPGPGVVDRNRRVQWPGMPISNGPPLYYAIQSNPDRVKITYAVLFAFQGGQTVRAMQRGPQEFRLQSVEHGHSCRRSRARVGLSHEQRRWDLHLRGNPVRGPRR